MVGDGSRSEQGPAFGNEGRPLSVSDRSLQNERMIPTKPEEYEAILADDPGNPAFVRYADSLAPKDPVRAIHVCMRGLSANPTDLHGRVLLANLLYAQGLIPFAVNELRILQSRLPENQIVTKLLAKLAPGETDAGAASPAGVKKGTTLAEADIDFETITALDEEDKTH